ncbi:hypothetical protein ACWCQK_26630 [Streptomyces sp. NPDC002306]
MNDIAGHGSRRNDVELQIDRVIVASPEQATVSVRCLRGPVHRDARFDRLKGSLQAVDLKLTQILFFGRRVAALDTGMTAFVTLRGEGVRHLRSGTLASGWQVIQGANSSP